LEEFGSRNLLVWLWLDVDGQPISTNLALFARPKHLALQPPQIEWEVADVADGRYQITLTADKPALWVWLEVTGERVDLSDNFFHLYAGVPHTVILTERGGKWGIEGVKTAVTVHSLYDTYQPT
jgi:hypothetical protein